MTVINTGTATDVGRRRHNNQDAILADERLFAVADGMGGYAGGDIASLTAIEALRAAFHRDPTAEGLERAVAAAAEAVQTRAQSDPELRRMGTTLSAVALVQDESSSDSGPGEPDGPGQGDVFVIAHVGDSRIYLLRDNELTQLTDDHTVPEELKRAGHLTAAQAAVDPRRHIISRALGQEVDMQTLIPYAGDRLVLCSDGLYNEVPEEQIASTLRLVANPDEAASRLVDLANQAGGGDNISVVVVDVDDDDDRARRASRALEGDEPPARPGRLMTAEQRNAQLRDIARHPDAGDDLDGDRGRTPWGTGQQQDLADLPTRRITLRMVAFVVLLLIVVGGAFAAVGWYARASYFVGLDEGRVTIFKGRPGGLLIFEPTVEEHTDVTEAAVPEARIGDVESGHEVTSIDEARRYVANLRRNADPAFPEPPTTATTATTTAATTATTTAATTP